MLKGLFFGEIKTCKMLIGIQGTQIKVLTSIVKDQEKEIKALRETMETFTKLQMEENRAVANAIKE